MAVNWAGLSKRLARIARELDQIDKQCEYAISRASIPFLGHEIKPTTKNVTEFVKARKRVQDAHLLIKDALQ